MKVLSVIGCVMLTLACLLVIPAAQFFPDHTPVLGSASAEAATLSWDRNSEADMKDYQVYACFTPNCVVIKSSSNFVAGAVIPQTATGVQPTYTIDLSGKEGAIAVTARDQTLNESGLSVAVPFDQKPPAAPANPALK